jgi:hypothetical protein
VVTPISRPRLTKRFQACAMWIGVSGNPPGSAQDEIAERIEQYTARGSRMTCRK